MQQAIRQRQSHGVLIDTVGDPSRWRKQAGMTVWSAPAKPQAGI